MNLPWTIWRSCFVELWRLLILSSIVLVGVLAFAASVRWIANGTLGPVDTLRFVFWAMLPMLQFALPFAGGFAATLAYHRMAQDNELVAAGGGGLSHRAILAPAAASGLLLAGVLWFLSSEIIPGFLQRMERLVFRDVSRLVVMNIEAGQSVRLQNRFLHADAVRRLGPDPERGAYEVLHFTGVALVEFDEESQIVTEATAAWARVAFADVGPEGDAGRELPTRGLTQVSMELHNVFAHKPGEGVLRMSQFWPEPWTQSQAPRDRAKYLSNRELARLPENPDRLNEIDNMRRGLALRLAEEEVLARLSATLRQERAAELTDADGRVYTVHARGLGYDVEEDAWVLLPLEAEAPIRVERRSAVGPAPQDVRFSAQRAVLRPERLQDALNRRVVLELAMEDVRTQGALSEAAGQRAELARGGLMPQHDPLLDLLAMSSHELLAEARARLDDGRAGPGVEHTVRRNENRLEQLEREVVSRLHDRWASSAACLVMILAGAVTAMRLGASLPLTVYLWSFFPALVAVITIAAGQHIAHRMGLWGIGVLWSGVGVLVVYTLSAFLLVRKH